MSVRKAVIPAAGGGTRFRPTRTQLSASPVYAQGPVAQRFGVGKKLGFQRATVEVALQRSDRADAFWRFLDKLTETRKRKQRAAGLGAIE